MREFEIGMAAACEREGFRLVHYSLQRNHVHLLVEADTPALLRRGMISICSRLARAANRVFGRRGSVLADRYHLRVLSTAREVRNVLRYVLLNARKHASGLPAQVRLDPASSARWFDGWSRKVDACDSVTTVRPVAVARSWLINVGWRRYGLIDPGDVPGSPR